MSVQHGREAPVDSVDYPDTCYPFPYDYPFVIVYRTVAICSQVQRTLQQLLMWRRMQPPRHRPATPQRHPMGTQGMLCQRP